MKPSMRTKIGSMFVVAMFLTTAWVGCIPAFDMDLSFSFSSDAEATTYSVTYHLESGDEGYVDSNVSTPYTVKSLSETGLYDGADKIYGWATSSGGSKAYNEGGEISSISDNIVLYPVWQAGNITYRTIDDQYEEVVQSRGSSESLTVKSFTWVYDQESSFAPEDGYQFFCWSTSKTGEGTSYSPGNVYSAKADLLLYPIYIPDTDAASYCGPNMKFRIADGVLTLIGSGQINAYGQESFPWDDAEKYDKSTITSISLPYGLSEIPDFAFNGFTNSGFQSIYLPDNLTSIGVGVFNGCSYLSTITVGSGNTTYFAEDGVLFLNVDDEASGRWKITELVTYPASNRGILNEDCYIIPYGCIKIQDYAFYGNTYLQYIYLTEKVQAVGDYSFMGCTALTSVSTPNGLTSIGAYAFRDCSSMLAAQFGTGLKSVGTGAFQNDEMIHAVVVDYGRTETLSLSEVFLTYDSTAGAWVDRAWYDYYPGDSVLTQTGAYVTSTASALTTIVTGHVYTDVKYTTINQYQGKFDKDKDFDANTFYRLGTKSTGGSSYDLAISMGNGVTRTDYNATGRGSYNSTTAFIIQGGSTYLGRLFTATTAEMVYIPESFTGMHNTFEGSRVKIGYLPDTALPNTTKDQIWITDPLVEYLEVGKSNTMFTKVDGCIVYESGSDSGLYVVYATPSSERMSQVFGDTVVGLNMSAIRPGAVDIETTSSVIFSDNLSSLGSTALCNNTSLACLALPSSYQRDSVGNYLFWGDNDLVTLICGSGVSALTWWNQNAQYLKVAVVDADSCSSFPISVSGVWYDGITGEQKYSASSAVITAAKGVYVSNTDYLFQPIKTQSGQDTGLYWNVVEDNITSEMTRFGGIARKVLTIVGSGEMPDYSGSFPAPWSGEDITFVCVQEGITKIGNNAFNGQSKLVSINIPKGTKTIGEYAFYGTAMLKVYIPCTVTSIGLHAFDSCPDLTDIYVSNLVVWDDSGTSRTGNKVYCSYDGVLMDKSQATILKVPEGRTGSFTPPSSCTTIYQYAFYKSALESVAFYQTVGSTEYGIITIQNNAFESSSIQMVDLRLVSSLGDSAFANCSELNTLIAGPSLSTFPTKAFEGCEYLYNMSFEANSLTFNAYSLPYKMKYTEAMGDDESISVEESTGYLKDDIGYYALYTINGDTSNRVKVRSHDWDLRSGIQYSSIPVSSMDQCGQYLYYAYIETPKLLLITGTGDMYDYQDSDGKRAPWYSMRASIQKVSLPDGMTKIGDYAFTGTKITSVSLPSSITTIGSYAFYGADLSIISLPSTVTGIGSYTFASTDLSSMEMNIAIPDHAFYDCETLQSVVLGTGVGTIGVSSFGDCLALATIVFQGATDLETSSFPTYAGYWFENGTGSAKGTIPDITEACYYTKEYQGTSATNCGTYDEETGRYSDNLQYNICNSILIITGSGAMADLSTASTELWRSNIGTSDDFSSVVFPAGLTHVGTHTFQGSHITSANLSACSSLTTIGNGSFSGASALTSVSIPDNVSIGASAFADCVILTDLDIGDGTSFGDNAFKGCTSITSVSLEDVGSMGSSVFEGCTGLKTATLTGVYDSNQNGGYTTEFGNYTFKDCTSLQTASLKKVKIVGASTFSGCTSLMLGDLVEVKEMGSSQFTGCTKLTNLKLTSMPVTSTSMSGISGPITLTISGAEIGSNSFQSHTTIVAIQTGASGNTSTIGSYAFQNCTSLTTVSLTDVVSIGDGAFQGCTSLESFVVTPTKLTSMGEEVFTDSKQGMAVNGSVLDNLSYTPATSSTVMKYAIDNHTAPKIELISALVYTTAVSALAFGNTGKTLTVDLSGYSLTVPTAGWTIDHGIILTTEDSSALDTGRFITSSDSTGVPYYDWKYIDTPDRIKYTIGDDVYWRALYDGDLIAGIDSFDCELTGMFVKWNNGSTGTMCDQCLLNLQDEGEYYTQKGNNSFGTSEGFFVNAVTEDTSYRSTYTD